LENLSRTIPSQVVSAALGTGKIKFITKEEALLSKDIEVVYSLISSILFQSCFLFIVHSKQTLISCWLTYEWMQ
jgi:hypothetical protein